MYGTLQIDQRDIIHLQHSLHRAPGYRPVIPQRIADKNHRFPCPRLSGIQGNTGQPRTVQRYQSQIHILWARFTVAPDALGKATLQGEFLGEDGVKYRVTMGIPDLSDVQEIPSGQTPDATYDLSGRRVSPTTRGLLIRNGKKILVR